MKGGFIYCQKKCDKLTRCYFNVKRASNCGSYFGVLMACGGLQDFLREQKPACTTTLVHTRVLPLYSVSFCPPYFVAAASWNECLPPELLPLLQVVISMIGNEDEDNIILFQLLNSVVEAGNENIAIHIPHIISSLVDAISKSIHPSLEPCLIWRLCILGICTGFFLHHSSEIGLSAKSEIKLTVMTVVKMIERLLEVIDNPSGGLLRDCFASLIETSIQLKELDEEMEDEQNDEESEDDKNNDDDDEEEIQDDEESESEYEETEEEFLERYAQAASALENGIVEGDAKDQYLEIELGKPVDELFSIKCLLTSWQIIQVPSHLQSTDGSLEEVDQQRIVLSLIGRYHYALIHGQALSSQLVSSFINAFPDCSSFFQQST
ncbi:hypothetical protein REPUB_Repub20aG0146600 [Reevesia pubescens]